jgi:hypothetical protein
MVFGIVDDENVFALIFRPASDENRNKTSREIGEGLMLYADPGSGVLIWQLLLALFFGATFYFSKLRHWAIAKLRPERPAHLAKSDEETRRPRSPAE